MRISRVNICEPVVRTITRYSPYDFHFIAQKAIRNELLEGGAKTSPVQLVFFAYSMCDIIPQRAETDAGQRSANAVFIDFFGF